MTHSSKTTHISVVTETFAPEVNGVANTLGILCQGLIERGHRVDLVRPRRAGEPRYRTAQQTPEHQVTPGLPLPGYPELRFGLPCARRLEKHWRRHRPAAIYVATQGPLGWSALSAARRLGIPVTTGFHTNFHQYCQFYNAGFLERLVRGYLRVFHNRSGRTLVPTRKVQQELGQWGIHNARLWSRGVDCTHFSPSKRSMELRSQWGLEPSDLAVLYVGRLAPEKNLDMVVAAFERLKAIHPSARLVLVGDGPMRAHLERRHPDYLFCGVQKGEALAQHYASADVFLFPSRSDTFGNVVTEAMASGLGVVAFDDAAAGEHMESGHNGLKVPLHDDAGFIRATMRLADQPTLLHRIRCEARLKALSLDWQALIDAFVRELAITQKEDERHAPEQSIPII